MRVQVYWNIQKRVWSVRNKATGRVVWHSPCLRLENCKFTVQAGGRARVLREKQKNIHAFVEGNLVESALPDGPLDCEAVTYNPYKHETFVRRRDETSIYRASEAILTTIFRPTKEYDSRGRRIEYKVPDVLIKG